MDATTQALRVRIYFDEDDTWRDQALHAALLDYLFRNNCLGATVFRGLAGFGASGELHTADIEALGLELPLVLEWVDQPQRVERVLPDLLAIVGERLVTVETVNVVRFPRHEVRLISRKRRVSEVMERDPATATVDMPLHEAARLLVARDDHALPVVDDERRVIGIVTSGDLVTRGGAPLHPDLLRALSPEPLAEALQALESASRVVADVMAREVVAVRPETDLASAAHLMVVHRLKQLPVVDQEHRLVGLLRSLDILHSVADVSLPTLPHQHHQAAPTARVAECLTRAIPSVKADASLAETLDAVVASPLHCVVVTDPAGAPIGIITDAELLRRLSPADQPGVARLLMSRIPLLRASSGEVALRQARGSRASDLMAPPPVVLSENDTVVLAIRRILEVGRRLSLIPVVDAEGRLAGAVEWDDLLAGVLAR